MNKLIKLSDTHYIIIDDSEIKENNYYVCWETINNIPSNFEISNKSLHSFCIGADNYKKITHSTKPLEPIHSAIQYQGYEHISLSEVEEVIYGYSVEKMALECAKEPPYQKGVIYGFEKGFKAHQELVKNKIILDIDTFKNVAYAFFTLHRTNEFDDKELELEFGRILNNNIQLLIPKTEWDIEFVDGKIKIIDNE